MTPNVTRITDACLKYGLSLDNKKQTVRGFTLLPSEYLCPKNFETLETKITEHTLCIHHFDGSWLSDEDKYRIALKEKMHRFFSAPLSGHIARFISIAKYESLTEAMVQSGKWLRQKKKDRKKYDIWHDKRPVRPVQERIKFEAFETMQAISGIRSLLLYKAGKGLFDQGGFSAGLRRYAVYAGMRAFPEVDHSGEKRKRDKRQVCRPMCAVYGKWGM